jgi:hypothetical protein
VGVIAVAQDPDQPGYRLDERRGWIYYWALYCLAVRQLAAANKQP